MDHDASNADGRGLGYIHRRPTAIVRVGSALRSRRVPRSFTPTRHPRFAALWGHPRDQGALQACTGYFTTRGKELVIAAVWGETVEFSPLASYAWGRGRRDSVLVDTGAFTGDVVWAENTIGPCPSAAWPWDNAAEGSNDRIVNVRPSVEAVMLAKRMRRTYPIVVREIVDDGDRLVQRILHSLDLGQLVGVAIPVGEELIAGTMLLTAQLNERGYHQVCILNWRKNRHGEYDFLIGNSWGATWGGTESPPGTQWCTAALVKQSIHTCYMEAQTK